MTLIVSVICRDGLVIAGDSLTTITNTDDGSTDTRIDTCKVFPFCEKFGVGTFGRAFIGGKSIYCQMRLFEQELNENGTRFAGVTEAAQAIGDHFHDLVNSSEYDLAYDLAAEVQLFGFRVVGYDDAEPKNVLLDIGIGRQVCRYVRTHFKCYSNGCDIEVVREISSLYQGKPSFLEDAIDYAEFLISETSSRTSSVGGPIDIALVTPSGGFEWKRKKPSIPD